MSAHSLPAVEIYVIIRALRPACRPAWVVRDNGATLVAVDPRSTKGETTAWAVEHLTPAELSTIRAAYNVPPVGQPCPDHWLDDNPVNTLIPDPLRLYLPTERSA